VQKPQSGSTFREDRKESFPRGIRAIGFDLGETLLTYRDTPPSWASRYHAALSDVATACAFSPTDVQFADAEAILGGYNTRINPRTEEVPARQIFRRVLEAWRCSPEYIDTAIGAFFHFFQQHLVVYPEVHESLTALRERGFKIGVLTDVAYGMPRPLVETDLAHAGVAPLVDVLLTSVDVGFRKPDPRGFLALAKALAVHPTEMIYIGNEAKDVIGGDAADVFSVLIDRGHLLPQYNQRAVIHSLAEIPLAWECKSTSEANT
jgi:putative hydrolase of the HAD superfamily